MAAALGGGRPAVERCSLTSVGQVQRAAGNQAVASLLSVQRTPGVTEGLAAFGGLVTKALAAKDLRRGDMGWRVSGLQQQLNGRGADPPLKVDGIFGRKTRQAVVELQQRIGMKATGVVTEPLRAVLAPKTAAPAGPVGPWGDRPKEAAHSILLDGKEVTVDEHRYTAEGGRLLVRYVTLVNAIKDDAIAVMKEYKLTQIRSLYDEPLDALRSAARSLSNGNLVWAARHLNGARRYVDIEAKAEKMFHDLGAVSYVGKQLDQAAIGFFEGSANALLGMVDMGGAVLGYDPGLVDWNTRQYARIKSGYASATNGIDPDFTSADEIGRTGGQVAAGLATAKFTAGAGVGGAGLVTATGIGGLLKVAGSFKTQHDVLGRDWAEILSDPVNMAQAIGAIAGAMGLGAAAFPAYRQFLGEVGLVVSAGQIGVTAGALFRLSRDKTLSPDQLRDKTLQLIGDALQNVAMTADAVQQTRQQRGDAPGGGKPGGAPDAADTLPGTGIRPRAPVPPVIFGRVVREVRDLHAARVLYAEMHRTREPHSLITDGGMADQLWRADSSGPSLSPPAWMTADGVTHFDASQLGLRRSPFASVPERATDRPIVGDVVRRIDDAAEAHTLYRRLWLDGEHILEHTPASPDRLQQRPPNEPQLTGTEYLDYMWLHDGGQGEAPIAWIRYGDGVVFFNWTKVPRPSVGPPPGMKPRPPNPNLK